MVSLSWNLAFTVVIGGGVGFGRGSWWTGVLRSDGNCWAGGTSDFW